MALNNLQTLPLTTTTQSTADAVAHLRRALHIANQAVVADVETNCPALRSPCGRLTWYDVRPMLDEREHAPQVVDMAREAITYGIDAGLLVRQEEHPHWVRVARPGC
jgi:hypothetical protein